MSLVLSKLEKLANLPDGSKQARCPACAETGQDRKGEHLRIYPDGKYGCCAHPDDKDHRKRIHALAGDHSPQGIRVKVAPVIAGTVIQKGLFGRLARTFSSPLVAEVSPERLDATSEVHTESAEDGTDRTDRTGPDESSMGLP